MSVLRDQTKRTLRSKGGPKTNGDGVYRKALPSPGKNKADRMYSADQIVRGLQEPSRAIEEGRRLYEDSVVKPIRTITGVCTLSLKVEPDFLVIGGQKCGTTSLREYLLQHPAIEHTVGTIANPPIFNPSRRWLYRARFQTQIDRRLSLALKGEYSSFLKAPDYIFDFRVPEHAAEVFPDARFVVLLRDPVDRAVSHYYHNRRRDREPLSFEEAIEAENSRIQPAIERLRQDPLADDTKYSWYSYVERGKYAEQLLRWFEHFPQERFLFLGFEEFFEAPGENLKEVFKFFGVKPVDIRAEQVYNRGDYSPDVDPEAIRSLGEWFEPHNEALYDLIGQEFGWEY